MSKLLEQYIKPILHFSTMKTKLSSSFSYICILLIGILLTQTSCTPDTKARFVSFNIRLDTPSDSLNSWKYRKEVVVTNVKTLNADFIGFQEVLKNQVWYLKKQLPEYRVVSRGRGKYISEDEATSIFFKKANWNLLDSGWFWLSETPNIPGSMSWNTACTRMATWIYVENIKTQQKLLVANTHLDHVSEEARVKGSALVIQKLTEINASAPLVLLGDFNAEETTPTITSILKNRESTGPTALKDTYREFHSEISATDATYRLNGAWLNNDTKAVRIDYIFASSYKKILNSFVNDGVEGNRFTSDHKPIVTDLVY